MKRLKILLNGLLLLIPLTGFTQVVAGWTFRNGLASELYADTGSVYNRHLSYIIATSTNNENRAIEFKYGVDAPNDFAATADQWDHGSMTKYWQIFFISKGYENLRLSSKQCSGENKTGPKYFQPQYKIGNGNWRDIPGSSLLQVGNDWVSGVVHNLPLPSTCDNSNDTIFIRWLMVTNINIVDDSVLAMGINKIDDIFITGNQIASAPEYTQQSSMKVYPSVSSGLFRIVATNEIKEIKLFDNLGSLIRTYKINDELTMDLSGQPDGMYYVMFINSNGNTLRTEKIVKYRK